MNWNSGQLVRVAIILAVLVPIGFAGFYSYQNTKLQSTQTAMERRESISILVATILTEKLDRAVDLSVSLSTRVRFRQLVELGRLNEAIKIMERVPSEFSYVDRLFITDPKGVLVTDVPALPGVRGRDFSSRDWYRGVILTGGPYISEIYSRTAAPQINVVTVAIPMKNQQHSLIGILAIQIKLAAFSEWFKGAPVDPDWLLYIVDQNGKTAFHPRFTDKGETADFSAVPAVQRVLKGNQGVDIEPADGEREERITAYTPVPRYGWGVILEQPTRTAFAARNAQLQRLLVIFGAMFVSAAFAAYLLMRARDDARRKADLEQLVAERTKEISAANSELEAFSYSVSHDLRAPLRSIDGFSRILLDDCADTLSGENKSHLQRIRAATQRMGGLIDDLLKLSRVTRAEIKRSAVDLSEIAHTVVGELSSAFPERRVTVHVEPGIEAVGDAALLRVMLENLIGNAWKFTGKTENARIEIGARDDRSARTVYFVRDNGAGFDPQYADKLFGTFQRLHGMDEFPGTGIGLATVQRIVRRHGGDIWAESKVGEGATFYFTLT